eukprot:g2182.t1
MRLYCFSEDRFFGAVNNSRRVVCRRRALEGRKQSHVVVRVRRVAMLLLLFSICSFPSSIEGGRLSRESRQKVSYDTNSNDDDVQRMLTEELAKTESFVDDILRNENGRIQRARKRRGESGVSSPPAAVNVLGRKRKGRHLAPRSHETEDGIVSSSRIRFRERGELVETSKLEKKKEAYDNIDFEHFQSPKNGYIFDSRNWNRGNREGNPFVVDSLNTKEGRRPETTSTTPQEKKEGGYHHAMRFQKRGKAGLARRRDGSGISRGDAQSTSSSSSSLSANAPTSSITSVYYAVSSVDECEAGTRAVVGGESAGSVYCEVCDVGTYSSEAGSGACTSCEGGRFSATPRATVCEECPAGYECSGSGSTEPVSCGSRQYALTGSEECSTCGFLFNANDESDGCTIDATFYLFLAGLLVLFMIFTAIGLYTMLFAEPENKFVFYDKAYPGAPYRQTV